MYLYRLNRIELMPCTIGAMLEFTDNPDVVLMQPVEALDKLIPSGILSKFDYPGRIPPHPTWKPKIVDPTQQTTQSAPTPAIDHVAKASEIISGQTAQVEPSPVEVLSTEEAAKKAVDEMDPELRDQMMAYLQDKSKGK